VLIRLTKREAAAIRSALSTAIADRLEFIECHRVTWAVRGHKKIIHQSNRKWTDAATRQIKAYRKLLVKLTPRQEP
jgi:hypothetical protein